MCSPRPSIFCIMPPHILRAIVERGTLEERTAASRTLALDSTFRSLRATATLLRPITPEVGPQPAAKQRTIYTANNQQQLPGTVVAVSVAEAYGGPSLLLGSFVLVGTFWILAVVYFLRFMPLVVRALQASMEQVDPTLEEAAGSLGARAWQRFTRVTLPLVWPGAVAGTLLAFVIALGEYVASVLVFVPSNRPISIAIASELRDFNLGSAAAYGVVLIVIISISMIVA